MGASVNKFDDSWDAFSVQSLNHSLGWSRRDYGASANRWLYGMAPVGWSYPTGGVEFVYRGVIRDSMMDIVWNSRCDGVRVTQGFRVGGVVFGGVVWW